MAPYRLTDEEFNLRLSPKMYDVTETAEAIVDIWPCVLELVKLQIISEPTYSKHALRHVYRDEFVKYDHILIQSSTSWILVILVVDIYKETLDGFYTLNLLLDHNPYCYLLKF
jgi:hypothetical protein